MSESFQTNLIASGLLLASLVLMRFVTIRMIGSWKVKNAELRRKWIVNVRNALMVVALLGLAIVWATELKAFALSILAIAIAIVVATKELILCFLGGLLRVSNHLYGVGDRIEVNGMKGDVIDLTFLTTTLYEIEAGTQQYSGRVVIFPNSILLANAVYNESDAGRYSLHTFKIPYRADETWERAENLLQQICNQVCREYIDDATKFLSSLWQKEALEVPSVAPRVVVSICDPEKIEFVVRVPAPNKRKGRIEQSIIKAFLSKTRNLEQNR